MRTWVEQQKHEMNIRGDWLQAVIDQTPSIPDAAKAVDLDRDILMEMLKAHKIKKGQGGGSLVETNLGSQMQKLCAAEAGEAGKLEKAAKARKFTTVRADLITLMKDGRERTVTDIAHAINDPEPQIKKIVERMLAKGAIRMSVIQKTELWSLPPAKPKKIPQKIKRAA